MRPTPYWIGQALFLAVFAALFDRMTNLMILALAVLQFLLVAGRLRDARQPMWLAAAPPLLTVGWWLAGMVWALRLSGSADRAAGLIVALSAAVVCLASYGVMAVAAGCLKSRRASLKVRRPAAQAWAPPWQMRHP